MERILKDLITDIAEAKKLSRDGALMYIISERLSKCLTSYEENLRKDVEYLHNREKLNLIRKLK